MPPLVSYAKRCPLPADVLLMNNLLMNNLLMNNTVQFLRQRPVCCFQPEL